MKRNGRLLKLVRAPKSQDQPLIEAVYANGQDHIFAWWDELSAISRQNLIDQIYAIDFEQIRTFQEILDEEKRKSSTPLHMSPAEVIHLPKTEAEHQKRKEIHDLGEEALRNGRVGVFLVAGGQGTRLGYDGPKGCFPISRMTGKSIFAMHAEKILAGGNYYDVRIPWYIMTSESNDEETRDFFRRHNFFGLEPSDVYFIKQRMLPGLDANGKLILDAKDHIFMRRISFW